MRFQLPKEDFKRLFTIASKGALDAKSHLPILTMVRIDAHRSGEITFEAYSVDATIRLRAKGDVSEPGSIAAPRALAARLQHMPEGMLELSDTNGAQITLAHASEKRRFMLFGMPVSDWPTTHVAPDGEPQKVSAAVLQLLIDRAEKAVSNDETKGATNSLLLVWRNGQIRAVGLDGHRMTSVQASAPVTGYHDLLIRKRNLQIVKAMLDMAAAAEIPDIGVLPGAGRCAFYVGDASYVCTLTDEKFPPYEQVPPGAWVRRFKLPRVKFLESVDGSTLVNKVQIHLQSKDGRNVLVSSKEAGSGDGEDIVESVETSNDAGVPGVFKVSLSPKYLREALEAVDEEDVFFCPTDFGGLVMVSPASETAPRPGDASHLSVIMSMRE